MQAVREEQQLALLRWQLWDLLRYILFDLVSPPAEEFDEEGGEDGSI